MGRRAQLFYYPSRLDDVLQPLPLCESDDGAFEKALLIDLSPGAINDLGASLKRCEEMARYAREAGESAVVIKPCGRGPGSVYQGPGEVDLFEAIEFVRHNFRIDPQRISLLGGSMGGAAVWYIASHYQDVFAAAAPFCGYCDYRLWTKPGGTVMRTWPWEHYSWQSRGAAFRPGNLSNMALWITHGQWDTSIGGGVPLEHSRQMVRLLDELGIQHTYTEVPACGHGCMREDTLRAVIPWLCRQTRKANPRKVQLTAHTLRHRRSFWLSIEQFGTYGQSAQANGERKAEAELVVETDNVRVLSIGPIRGARAVVLELDDQRFDRLDLAGGPSFFLREGDAWVKCRQNPIAQGQKRHGLSGPFADLFFEPLCIVRGTTGTEQETFLMEWMARHVPAYFKKTNGGVHRGVFHGESLYELRVVRDEEVTDEMLERGNLILWGNAASNSVIARFGGECPVAFGQDEMRLGDRMFRGRDVGGAVCVPSPANPQRYVALMGGVSTAALTGITHLNLQLLPDYLAWSGSDVLDFGFLGTSWR